MTEYDEDLTEQALLNLLGMRKKRTIFAFKNCWQASILRNHKYY